MDKCKEIIKKIYKVIINNNIHIWGLVIILFLISIFGVTKITNGEKVSYPKMIAVTGDSYAGYLMTFEDLRDYGMVGYAIAGKTFSENYYRMREAMHQDLDIVVISVGVNDVIKGTEPEDFAKLYRSLLLESVKYGKTIITHSYLDFKYNDNSINTGNIYKYKPFDYDVVIRKEMYGFDNVHYIDMRDYEKEEYLQDDKIHYNKAFYDVLYDRMKEIIDAKYKKDLKQSLNVDIYMLYASFFALLLTILVLKLTKINNFKSRSQINQNKSDNDDDISWSDLIH